MKPAINFLSLPILLFTLFNSSIAQTSEAKSEAKTIPLPTTLSQSWSAIVQLYDVKSNGAQPIGFGFFINPWMVVTSHQLLQEANRDNSLRLAIRSIDGKTNHHLLSVELQDKNKDWVKIEVRERSSQVLVPLEANKAKLDEKMFILRKQPAPVDATPFALGEIAAPLPKELRGMPLFNEQGQLIGMGVDSGAKVFSEYAMLPAKTFASLSELYPVPYKNGKLVCPPNTRFCFLGEMRSDKQEANPLKHIRPYTGNFDDPSFTPPLPNANPRALSSDAIGGTQGRSLRRVGPPYPPEAKAAGARGTVHVRIVIDEQGDVIMAQSVTGPSLLRQVSLEAARQWLFEPIIVEGKKIKAESYLTFNFTLQ
jgi:TonB family protein